MQLLEELLGFFLRPFLSAIQHDQEQAKTLENVELTHIVFYLVLVVC